MAGFLGRLVGAVAGPLIGGLFGNKKKKETVSNTIDYVKLRENAEAAGFNPLTALRNGGGAGFTQTHSPVLSSGAYFANAVGDGLSRGIQAAFDYNPLDEEKSQLELQIMKGQLTRINQDIASATRLGGAPVATGSRYQSGGGELGKQTPPTVGPTSITNPLPKVGGYSPTVNTNLVDAEAWETRYGDIAQEVGGLINVFGDAYHNYMDWYPNFRDAAFRGLGAASGATPRVKKKTKPALSYRKDAQGYLRQVR